MPSPEDTTNTDPAAATAEAVFDPGAPRRAALLGVVVNAGLAAAKLIAGVAGQSFALVADAVESMVDIAGSAVVWGALHYGEREPDAEHPFGHGKAESLAALAVACLIVVVGVGIAVEAVRQILSPHGPPAAFTLVVLVGVVIVKEILFRVSRSAARRAGSSAGHADAWHHRSDAITSLFAFVGITAALFGGPSWAPADDWAALAASVVIVFNGVRLVREPVNELLDRNDDVLANTCRDAAMTFEDVRDVERSEVRKVGRTHRVVMHVEVDPEMTVEASHRLTGRIKALIREREPSVATVLVHVEPYGHAEERDAEAAAAGRA